MHFYLFADIDFVQLCTPIFVVCCFGVRCHVTEFTPGSSEFKVLLKLPHWTRAHKECGSQGFTECGGQDCSLQSTSLTVNLFFQLDSDSETHSATSLAFFYTGVL